MADIQVLTGELAGESGESEDRVFVTSNAAVVLDGVGSPEGSSAGSGGWYAERLGCRLVGLLKADPAGALPDLLEKAIAEVATRANLVPGDAPACTLAAVRWHAGRLDGLVLGDSPIVIVRRDGTVEELRDSRHAAVVSEVRRAHVSAAREATLPIEERRALTRATWAAKTARMNRHGGYWIAEATPEAARHAVTGCWPLEEVSGALVTSDGVSQGVDDYGTPTTWTEALRITVEDGADALVRMVHQTEESDPHGHRWSRGKRHDDKAVAAILVSPRVR